MYINRIVHNLCCYCVFIFIATEFCYDTQGRTNNPVKHLRFFCKMVNGFKYFWRKLHLRRLSRFWIRLWCSIHTNLINIQAIKWIISSPVIGKTSKWKLLGSFFSLRSWLNKLLIREPKSKPPIYYLKKVVIFPTTKRNGKLLQMLQHVLFLNYVSVWKNYA